MALIDQSSPANARITLGGLTVVVTNIIALRNLSGPDLQGLAQTQYGFTFQDGLGDEYIWNTTDTTPDNGSTVIAPYVGPPTGRWNALVATAPAESSTVSVPTIAALKAVATPNASVTYIVQGYYAPGDGGGGNFLWNASSSAADNGGTVIALTAGGTGRFNLITSNGLICPKQFGCYGDDSHDDTFTMQTMYSSAQPGWQIDFGAYTYLLLSASLASLTYAAILIPVSGILIKGERATVTVSGTSSCGIWYARGQSNISVSGINYVGNLNCTVNTINNSTGLLFTTEGASADCSDIKITDCSFSNFMGQGAVYFTTLGTTFNLRQVTVERCRFFGGDTYQPATAGTITAAIYVSTNTAGNIYDTRIVNNYIEATMLKCGIQFVGNSGLIYNSVIVANTVLNAGLNYVSTIVNSYAIGLKPNIFKCVVSNNILSGAVDCGIYAYSGGQFTICANYIENVTSTDDSILLRGAIVCNGSNSDISGNSIGGCFFGMQIQGAAAGGVQDITISGNTVAAQRPLTLKYNPSATCSHVTVVGNTFDGTLGLGGGHQAVIFQDTSAFTLDNVTISDNDIIGYIGITDYSQTANGWNRMSIIDNRVTQLGAGAGIALTGSGWVDCSISFNTVYSLSTGGISIQFSGQGADTNLSMVGNTVRNNTNGSARAYETYQSRGIFKDNQAINCTNVIYTSAGAGGGILGLQIPVGTANMTVGNFVQYIGDPQSGFGLSDVAGYYLLGWKFDGSAWQAIYTPKNVIAATTTFNPGSVGNGASVNSGNIAVTGAVLGDFVDVAAPYDLKGCAAFGYVQAAGEVVIGVQNATGAGVTLGSGTWNIRVTPT
jgi:hypothetical protein